MRVKQKTISRERRPGGGSEWSILLMEENDAVSDRLWGN
jgi:hypothetical protein